MIQRFLLLSLLLLATVAAHAQDSYSFDYLCSDSSQDIYAFDVSETGIWTFVPQDGDGQVVYLDNPQGLYHLAFPKPSRGVLLYLGMSQLGITYAGNTPCDSTMIPSIDRTRLTESVLMLMTMGEQ